MSDWIESDLGVKFLCWDEVKDSIDNPDDAVVVKKGEKIQGIIQNIDTDEDKKGNIKAYKWTLKAKDIDKPVIVWSNASMFRQIQDIGVEVGDEVQLIYQKDYEAKGGNIGRDIKLRVKKK